MMKIFDWLFALANLIAARIISWCAREPFAWGRAEVARTWKALEAEWEAQERENEIRRWD